MITRTIVHKVDRAFPVPWTPRTAKKQENKANKKMYLKEERAQGPPLSPETSFLNKAAALYIHSSRCNFHDEFVDRLASRRTVLSVFLRSLLYSSFFPSFFPFFLFCPFKLDDGGQRAALYESRPKRKKELRHRARVRILYREWNARQENCKNTNPEQTKKKKEKNPQRNACSQLPTKEQTHKM